MKTNVSMAHGSTGCNTLLPETKAGSNGKWSRCYCMRTLFHQNWCSDSVDVTNPKNMHQDNETTATTTGNQTSSCVFVFL
jgi:hypothetical protein